MTVNNFGDFCAALLDCGFSMGGGNAKGIYAVIPFGWEEQGSVDSPVRWHTGDPGTDPWEWRMRVLEERDDIAYSKLFFRTSGYITREWYPYFYAVRRRGGTFWEAYYGGTVGGIAKRIYDVIEENGATAYHDIKRLCGISREDNAKFERAVTELQMRMFITMCGRAQKTNLRGEGYGWSSTVFMTAEAFWARRGLTIPDLDPAASFEAIKERVLSLNPEAAEKNIARFITG